MWYDRNVPQKLGRKPKADHEAPQGAPEWVMWLPTFGEQKKVPNPQGGFILGNELERPLRFNPAPGEMLNHSQILVRNRQRELFPQK